ncbi:MAG: metal-dependent hydrolase [Betaproteobacteria bacterium]|nr:metal-dependent hydrolase [Betaproteobacteria bacterium]
MLKRRKKAPQVIRFRKVSVQTVLAPVLSAVLFLIVFQHVLAGRMNLPGEMSYAAFLVPGLAMMALQQNAFANSSSSLTQSKVTGNLVFLLLTPLPAWSWFVGYVGGGVVRGLVVGLAVWLSTLPFVWTWPVHPGYALAMLLIAAVLMSALGLLAGLWADKWDQLSLFQSFLINPLSFLAGVFYSVQSLQEPWKQLAHANPFFYMIDGLRWSFYGVSDAAAELDFAVSIGFCIAVSLICCVMLQRGWRIRH